MRILSLATFVLFSSLLSFCQNRVEYKNSNTKTQLRDVENFNGLKVQNAIKVELSYGNSNSVSITTSDPDDQRKVITEVKNGILFIHVEKGNWSWTNRQVIAHVTMQTINSLDVSGACTILIKDKILSKNLDIELSGASSIKGEIKAINLNAEISGASSFKISGISENTTIKANGASSFKAFDFSCDNAEIVVSGASSVSITVNKSLSAIASGASSISYKGNPQVKESKSSGASSIKHKED